METQYLMHQAMAPLRAQPSDAAEMVSQLLFGDRVSVQDRDRQWMRVQVAADHYEGWIDEKALLPMDALAIAQVDDWEFVLDDALVLHATRAGATLPLRLGLGAQIPRLRQGGSWAVADWTLDLQGHVGAQAPAFAPEMIAAVAGRYLGTPYLWGGKSLAGIDCSGLTQMVFAILGRQLPRDARDQALIGQEVPFQSRAAGDLAFFENTSGKIHHTGIILPDGRIRHASGDVHDATLTAEGIVGKYSGQQTHRLCSIKRIT